MAITLSSEWGEGATALSRRDGEVDPLIDLLGEADHLIQDHCRALQDLHDRIRQIHHSYLGHLHGLEDHLHALQRQLERAQSADPGVSDGAQPILVHRCTDQLQTLRQEQEWLAQRLMLLAAAARRLQAVERQSELTASYLRGDLLEGGGDEELAEMAQAHALQAQEDERRRLAREVHDGPAQALVNAIMELGHFRRLLNSDPRSAEDTLERLEGDLRTSLSEVRQFVQDLQPGPIADLGLVVALQRYLEEYARRTRLEVGLSAEPNLERLPLALELGVFRIVQEALQNVRKHAGARRVLVTLSSDEHRLRVVVRDDGVGFDPEAQRGASGHFGLTSMAERAQLLRAELIVSSSPGAGTQVSVVVPIGDDPSAIP